jgi:hypothetical protein
VQAKEVIGMGEKRLLYDNSNPEGRYYSRTVTVIVETPVEAAEALRRRRAEEASAAGTAPEEGGGGE